MMLLDEFLIEQEALGRSPDTLYGYRKRILSFARFIGKLDVNDIEESDIRDFILLKRRQLKNSSVAVYISNLKTFFTWCKEKGYIGSNPMRDVKIAPVRYPPRIFLAKKDVRKLFAACQSTKEELILALGLYAGLRSIEIYRLKKTDVQNDLLKVHGKHDKYRTIPISPALKKILGRYLKEAGAEESLLGISRGHVRNTVIKIGKRANLKVSSHILRHTFATYALRVGDIRSVQQLLGHADIKSTEVYLHSDPKHLEGVVGRLNF